MKSIFRSVALISLMLSQTANADGLDVGSYTPDVLKTNTCKDFPGTPKVRECTRIYTSSARLKEKDSALTTFISKYEVTRTTTYANGDFDDSSWRNGYCPKLIGKTFAIRLCWANSSEKTKRGLEYTLKRDGAAMIEYSTAGMIRYEVANLSARANPAISTIGDRKRTYETYEGTAVTVPVVGATRTGNVTQVDVKNFVSGTVSDPIQSGFMTYEFNVGYEQSYNKDMSYAQNKLNYTRTGRAMRQTPNGPEWVLDMDKTLHAIWDGHSGVEKLRGISGSYEVSYYKKLFNYGRVGAIWPEKESYYYEHLDKLKNKVSDDSGSYDADECGPFNNVYGELRYLEGEFHFAEQSINTAKVPAFSCAMMK